MPQKFSDIPQRVNSNLVDSSWWNLLKLAGVSLELFLGDYAVATDFSIANNQASPANITGLLFDGTVTRSFNVTYHIYRKTMSTGATELAETGSLIGVYKSVAGTWEMTQAPVVGDAGVTFSMNAATGQVQYESSNITGTASVSRLTYKFTTIGV